MRRGDIYIASLDPTEGHEQQGTRPVLVVSTEAFNEMTRLPVILPITRGGNFAKAIGYAVPLQGNGLRTTGIVRCDQPRVLDIAARRGRFVERLDGAVLDDVLARAGSLFL